ncbi:MFS transporter [Micromonospora sp. NBC_01813]|uniref:MFS transporter n=1 Tax=Micromonospora sp. NBC_01813 TaxID=2975988 RepID=UPI002DDBB8F5|nr:MFS transporter [Micromonospora sp. NBC_01813]WSA10522.1 MFS transporter [Micromonospora sp. NBC_01813]
MSTTVTAQRRRAALFTAFFVTGLCMATWVSRTPAIRDAIDASTAQMGLIIAGLSVGSMVGISVTGTLVARRGARFVVLCGMAAVVVGVAVVAVGTATAHGWLVATGLAFFGYGMGSGEIGQNVEGVDVEQALGKTVVPSLHGCYSLGVGVGGLGGLAATTGGISVVAHLAAVAVVTAAASSWLVANLASAVGQEAGSSYERASVRGSVTAFLSVWTERRTLAIGIIVLGMALAEGSANDWLPLIMVDGFSLSAATASLVYAFFGLSMAIGRFSGGYFLDRFGRAPVMVASAVLAVLGIATVSFAPTATLGAVGVFFWGIGASLGFPVALSAAGDDPVGAARRVSAVAAAGYTAFLVGPPILGVVGEHVGLRSAIVLVLVMVIVSAFFSRAVSKPAAEGKNHVEDAPAQFH